MTQSLQLCLRSCLPLLAACCLPPVTLAAPARVTFEVLTEQGLPPGSEQTWYQTITARNVADLQFHSADSGQRAEIRTLPGQTPTYHVVAILTARNQLVVPGHSFSASDRAGLGQWIDRLRAAGPEVAGASQKLPFDLSPQMLAQARSDLRRQFMSKTSGADPWKVLGAIQQTLSHSIRTTTNQRDRLRHSGRVASELSGLTCGTALAALLRPAGLAIAPFRSAGGELEYKVFEPAQDADIWPIGWPAEDRRRELVPKLFEFVNLEVNDVSVAEAIESIRQRLGVILLYDQNALARHGIDPAAIQAKMPLKRISYSLALQKVLFQARLKLELRVDEAGRPFFWVTSIKPLD